MYPNEVELWHKPRTIRIRTIFNALAGATRLCAVTRNTKNRENYEK